MDDGGVQGLVAEDYLRKSQFLGFWTCGPQQKNGPRRGSTPIASYVEHLGRIHAILCGLSSGNIRPQEECECVVANPTTRGKGSILR